MRGLDEAKALYENYGTAMLHERFSEYESRIAVGLAGHGSECFGFDDEISRDHDFEPGFCMWLSADDDISIGIRLASEYRKMLSEVLSASDTQVNRSAMSEKKLGVVRTGDFFRRYTGSDSAPQSLEHWLSIPSWALAEATNGQVWRDELGEFSAIREILLHGMPEDVRRKKIAYCLINMAQSGQYNYPRCVRHGEKASACLALTAFVQNCAELIYLLNRAHAPYYKWIFRGMDSLSVLSDMKEPLSFLLLSDNSDGGIVLKSQIVEDICANIISILKDQGLTDSGSMYLEEHAYEVRERIENQKLQSMHIMEI